MGMAMKKQQQQAHRPYPGREMLGGDHTIAEITPQNYIKGWLPIENPDILFCKRYWYYIDCECFSYDS
jgi:hypothetical protein